MLHSFVHLHLTRSIGFPPRLYACAFLVQPLNSAGAFVLLLVGGKFTDTPGPARAFSSLNVVGGAADRRPAWVDAVSGCTGPNDGYVYGGEAASVLRFVRRGRGRNGDTGGGDGLMDNPALSDVIRWVWASKRDLGVLTYKLSEVAYRWDTGEESGWECVFVANFGKFWLRVS